MVRAGRGPRTNLRSYLENRHMGVTYASSFAYLWDSVGGWFRRRAAGGPQESVSGNQGGNSGGTGTGSDQETVSQFIDDAFIATVLALGALSLLAWFHPGNITGGFVTCYCAALGLWHIGDWKRG